MRGGTHGCPHLALLWRGLNHPGMQQAQAVVQIAQGRAGLACRGFAQRLQLGGHLRQHQCHWRVHGLGWAQRHKIKIGGFIRFYPDMGGFGGVFLQDEGQAGLVMLSHRARDWGAGFARRCDGFWWAVVARRWTWV